MDLWKSRMGFGNTYVLTPKSYDNASNVETPADRVPASWSFTFDNIGPTSNTTFPTNGAALSSISAISGAASDLTSDISMVEVNIKNTTTTKYWTGSTWVVVENNWLMQQELLIGVHGGITSHHLMKVIAI